MLAGGFLKIGTALDIFFRVLGGLVTVTVIVKGELVVELAGDLLVFFGEAGHLTHGGLAGRTLGGVGALGLEPILC